MRQKHPSKWHPNHIQLEEVLSFSDVFLFSVRQWFSVLGTQHYLAQNRLGGGIAASLAIWILYIYIMIYLGFRASPISYKQHEPKREQFHPVHATSPRLFFCIASPVSLEILVGIAELLVNHKPHSVQCLANQLDRLVIFEHPISSRGILILSHHWTGMYIPMAKIIIGIPMMIIKSKISWWNHLLEEKRSRSPVGSSSWILILSQRSSNGPSLKPTKEKDLTGPMRKIIQSRESTWGLRKDKLTYYVINTHVQIHKILLN